MVALIFVLLSEGNYVEEEEEEEEEDMTTLFRLGWASPYYFDISGLPHEFSFSPPHAKVHDIVSGYWLVKLMRNLPSVMRWRETCAYLTETIIAAALPCSSFLIKTRSANKTFLTTILMQSSKSFKSPTIHTTRKWVVIILMVQLYFNSTLR